MKDFSCQLFALSLLFSALFSIQNMAQTAFPLAIGNEWYYTITHYFQNPPMPPSSYKYGVAGDTLMPNGNRYWILEPRDMFDGKYIRSDSQYIYYYWQGADKRVFNIKASPDTTYTINWGGYMYADPFNSYQTSVFGKSTNVYNFQLGGLIFGSVGISNDLGYVNYEYRGDYPGNPDDWVLKGCIISDTLYGEMTDVYLDEGHPNSFKLFQNYPNPFNPVTNIEFQLAKGGLVSLKVFDALGNEVAVLINEIKPAGDYQIKFNGSNIPSGIYFYRIIAGRFTETKKLILLK